MSTITQVSEEATQAAKVSMVKAFYEAMGKVHDKELSFKLVMEEAKELREAWLAFVKEMADLEYVIIGYAMAGGTAEELFEPLKPVAALMGLRTLMEPQMNEVFERVHASNMTKFDNGMAVFRDDGKLLKSEHYREPFLDDIF